MRTMGLCGPPAQPAAAICSVCVLRPGKWHCSGTGWQQTGQDGALSSLCPQAGGLEQGLDPNSPCAAPSRPSGFRPEVPPGPRRGAGPYLGRCHRGPGLSLSPTQCPSVPSHWIQIPQGAISMAGAARIPGAGGRAQEGDWRGDWLPEWGPPCSGWGGHQQGVNLCLK